MKAKIGHHAYTIQTLIELVKAREEIFDIELNDGEFKKIDVKTQFMFFYNGKYGGGGKMINPTGIINDGLWEFCYFDGQIG